MYDSVDVELHRVRFYTSELYSINCIAHCVKLNKVAILRRRIRKYKTTQSDVESLVEIWNCHHKASFLEQTILDDSDNLSLVEALGWSKNGRLFSCGLNTYLNEYDLDNNCVKQSVCVNSSPAWCLSIDAQDQYLAVGTENGHICIYQIGEGDSQLEYYKMLSKTDNRILCLEWYKSSDSKDPPLLVGGSIDYIKIWNFQSGRCVDFIKVGNTGVVVWSLKVLRDFTIVSGDSNGTTSFWNGKMLNLMSSYKAHKGDILTICTTPDQESVFSSGIDPCIVTFSKNASKSSNTWIKTRVYKPHSHDVRALATNDRNQLFSGGIDTFLVKSSLSKHNHVSLLANSADKMCLASSVSGNYVCFQYTKFVQVWKLGRAVQDGVTSYHGYASVGSTPMSMVENASKLLELTSRKTINCCTFNNKWIVFANYSNIKVFTWNEDQITKVKSLHNPIGNISHLALVDENICVVGHGKTLELLKLDLLGVVSLTTKTLKSRIFKLSTSATSQGKLVVSLDDPQHTIIVLSCDGLRDLKVLSQFHNHSLPTAIKMNHNRLLLAYANYTLIEYDLEDLKLSKSYSLNKFKSNENSESTQFNEHWPIKQIAFADKLILFCTDNNLYSFNSEKQRVTKCDIYRYINFMDNLVTGQLVLVEVTPEALFSLLPPTIKSQSFGT